MLENLKFQFPTLVCPYINQFDYIRMIEIYIIAIYSYVRSYEIYLLKFDF